MPDNKNQNQNQNKDKQQQKQQPMKQGGQKDFEKQDVGNQNDLDVDKDLDEQGEITQKNPRQGGTSPDIERE